ncbi:MAG: prepilin peptidase [Candidatus Pacebacteria bacterium]|nr:prepilin peptidase [Candidatus Paceibacterota bacterium]
MILLPPLFAVAGYTEVSSRRIPNWLTLGGLICGLAGSWLTAGSDGLTASLWGAAIGGGIFLPFCLAGVLGGGDFKLMAAVGSIVGHPMVWQVLLYTCFSGGALALIILIWSGRLFTGLKRTFRLLLGRKVKESEGLQKVATVPYGLAIAVGTFWALLQ